MTDDKLMKLTGQLCDMHDILLAKFEAEPDIMAATYLRFIMKEGLREATDRCANGETPLKASLDAIEELSSAVGILNVVVEGYRKDTIPETAAIAKMSPKEIDNKIEALIGKLDINDLEKLLASFS